MEATNKIQIVRVEIVRDFDKSYYANLYDENGVCHNLSKEYTDFRTLKTLCKKEYGVNLPNLSQIGFETHGRKSYAYISTETPQISTETAETVNVSAEGENAAERAGNKPERKIKYFHYTPEQLKRYIIDVYDKRANGEWVLDHQEDSDHGYFDVIDDKVIYWHNKPANSFSYANMDFNSPTCGRCFQINGTYQKDRYKVSDEILMEFMCGHTYRTIQKHITYDKGKYEHCYTIKDGYGDFNVNDFSYTLDGIMQRFNDCYKDSATIIWQSPEFAPQSPGTPQTVECAAEGDKSDAKHAKAITMLNAKLVKLQNEAHKYDDCNRLSRKLYFSDAKRQVRIEEQCTAINAALALLNGKQWHELDIYNVVLMSVNSRNSEKDKMLEYAYSGGLYEKQKALMYAFETSLPICKKQIFEAIQMQIKNSRLAQTA